MFFVKTKLNDDTAFTVKLTEENLFTVCPDCGKAVPVNLSWVLDDGDTNLFATSAFCPECNRKRAGQWDDCDNAQADVNVPALLASIAQNVRILRRTFRKAAAHGNQ